ncbi:type I-E CRISPR-associated protein Cas6/Cse3/CasE [Nocardia terpenica]|uniref:Type I-E CRISPR-associated protein Cas6/Cse3/CasE n=1 Tax=Nocardia terpenica TaxID=455432 RepID=A0A291RHG9_9NOCA|nr:type I-E CRISPR-associated protein Cas6/Cse3/CasE [Nocardia terpenica]ATL66775.1 type I-E CRISPR-associated protein Cas6/Cse3/CasE [Nocardia terpenica]
MYLSKVPLNPARRDTSKFLSSPQVIHGAVMKSFPPDALERHTGDGRVLWRVDQTGHAINLYVVSPVEPDFTHIVEQTGWPTTTAWATRKYHELLDKLATGQRWHFRFTANPVGSHPNPNGASTKTRGKLKGLSAEQQAEWLQRKAVEHGFTLADCGPADRREDDVAIVNRQAITFRRGPATVSLSTVTFEGTLAVTDPALLRSALINGIGRAKGYGCGLLTLAPAR